MSQNAQESATRREEMAAEAGPTEPVTSDQQPEEVEVAVNQVWADNDPRSYSTNSLGEREPRLVMVLSVGEGFATVQQVLKGSTGYLHQGRQTRIRVDRFGKRIGTSYTFVEALDG